MTIKTLSFAAIAALTLASAAQAADAPSAVSRTVSYADLDLSSDAGARKMAQRIRTASNEVCGGLNRLTFGSPALKACRARVAAVSSDRLYPVRLSEEIAQARPGTGLSVIDSRHGHDGFPIETTQVGRVIDAALRAT